MGRNVVVLNHLANLQWAQLLGGSWLWGGREERRRGKIKTGCKTEYIVTVGQNVPWPTTRSLWTFWYPYKNSCDWLSLSGAISSYSHQVCQITSSRRESLQFQGRAVFSRNYIWCLQRPSNPTTRSLSWPQLFFLKTFLCSSFII